MRAILTLPDASPILSPYFGTIEELFIEGFEDAKRVRQHLVENGLMVDMKPRTKGSLINDCIAERMKVAFHDNPNVRVVEADGIPGAIFHDKIFLRFNKMDEHFSTAIQRTKKTKRYLNQENELDGIPDHVMIVWGGFTPNRPWTELKRYFLCCIDGTLNWYYDFRDNASEQLILLENMPPKLPKTDTKRGKIKKDHEEESGTGTQG